MQSDAPLLFFDSGIGGLSILGPTRELLPNAPIVYAADNAAFPYGTRSEAEIAARVPALLGRLVERVHPRLVTIACNTASTIALDHVRAALDVPVVGTVPAIKPAAEHSQSRVIGVLGTQATVRQPYVDDLAAKFASDCTVLRHGSAALVELAEQRLASASVDKADVIAAAQPLFDQPEGDRLDTVVLACTHFPLLADWLREAHPGVAFIDGGQGIARRIAYLTNGQSWPDARPQGRALFTGAVPQALAPAMEGFGITDLSTL
ncbi:glutamate racemase [Sphingomicrobium sediminis]|uniref:Glutamate racemase n=1 Tax=Sphingomicrobium sediminis TaxID=2950949 RepID=A0A9X2EKJ9_9SPHN|nr:glutamate racemase [Sphingomicrobium sediminis]MCM8557087.1 glutamate racemase [Sphingomicrobium sediminis]